MAYFNLQNTNNLLQEAASKELTDSKKVSMLYAIAKDSIANCVKKFPEYKISKYYKTIHDTENKDLFLEGDGPLNLVNCISPAEFSEEYDCPNWGEYNKTFNCIVNYIKEKAKKAGIDGEVGADIEKDGGTVWYQE